MTLKTSLLLAPLPECRLALDGGPFCGESKVDEVFRAGNLLRRIAQAMEGEVDATESVAFCHGCSFCNREKVFRNCSRMSFKSKGTCLSGILS